MTVVETAQGKLQGRRTRGVLEFRGIPYASAPVGDLRFRAPQPMRPWAGVADATAFGASAVQSPIPMMKVGAQSEDCLFLNVWTPGVGHGVGETRPVMLWIHGGGFVIGSSSQGEYNAAELAQHGDVVVVTINYRLGALGFGYFDEILGGRLETDANVGLCDQMAALRWVQENIEAFGGDPSNVTLFGESAGAMSVGTLMGTPAAKGLFHHAILQSGAAHHSLLPADATRVAEVLLHELSVDPRDPSALRTMPAEAFLKAMPKALMTPSKIGTWQLPNFGMGFVPVVDGEVLPAHPQDAIEQGLSRDVNTLIGTAHDEWRLFMEMGVMAPRSGKKAPWESLTEEGLADFLEHQLPGHGARAAGVYREALGERGTAREVFQALTTDYMFRIPAIRLAEAQAQHNPATYMYRFDWRSPMFGACHAVDIPFVFRCVDTPFGRMLSGGGAKANALAEHVSDAWIQFAFAGDPGHSGLPKWPRYERGSRSTLVFSATCSVLDTPREAQRRFWDSIGTPPGAS